MNFNAHNPRLIAGIREKSPLIHHITNIVTINDCATVTLSIGASPVMSDSVEEAAQMVAIASALVLNMGTPHPASLSAMLAAGKAAREKGIPVVFDPVGASATAWRQEVAGRIMEEIRPDIVKGNVAEIRYLAGQSAAMRGVDSLESDGAVHACQSLARRYGIVAYATGACDAASDGRNSFHIQGGNELMGRVCGTGCMSASLMASCAACSELRLAAAIGGGLIMKQAGEAAALSLGVQPGNAVVSRPGKPGPIGLGSFRTALFDALCRLQDSDLAWAERVIHAPV
jgi:hydroxyethylthiazole kinase